MTKKEQTFADSIQQLEQIVRQLEQGDVPLEDAIQLFQTGMELSKNCHDKLQNAEDQLVILMDSSGNEQPFTVDGEGVE